MPARRSSSNHGTRLATILLPLLAVFVPFVAHAQVLAPVPAAAPPSPAATPASPGAAIPAGPAGRHLASYIAAFNSGDDAQLERFLREEYAASALAQRPVADRMGSHRQIRAEHGTWELRRAAPVGESSATAFVRGTKSGQWLRIKIDCEPQEPFAITGMRFDRSEGPDEAESELTPIAEKDAIQALDALVQRRAAEDDFSGVVVALRGGRTIYSKAVGFADREQKVPNRLDTKFNLGSINKLFTKIAIARLALEGKLKLDDRLIQHLPDYPNRSIAEQVTIRQLLEHRSGLGDIFGERFDRAPHSLRTLKDYLALFADQPLQFAPGTDQRYSNAGFIVLGLVIERSTGQSYYDVIQQWIYDPAGMTDSGSFAFDARVENRAVGYTRREGPQGGGPVAARQPNTFRLPGRGSSAGGGFSTAPDLQRFVAALRSAKLLKPGWTRWILGGPPPAPGAEDGPLGNQGGLGVAGGAPGINAALELDLAGDYLLIVLGNYDPPAAESLEREGRGLLERIAK